MEVQEKFARYNAATYLTFNDLRAKLGGRARSSIYRDLDAGRLPQPIKLGGKLYWIEGDVDAHLRALSGDPKTAN